MIYPQGAKVENGGNPLDITKTQRDKMVKKAKELLKRPMSNGKLKELLNDFYIKSNKHYTNLQLKDIVDQVALDLTPDEEDGAEA